MVTSAPTRKWLEAGVLEDGLLRHATEGSPQGGVISPCLSNIFLHHVLDEWFENEVQPRLKGKSTLVRFADDAVMAFADFQDAKRVLDVLGKRHPKEDVYVFASKKEQDTIKVLGTGLGPHEVQTAVAGRREFAEMVDSAKGAHEWLAAKVPEWNGRYLKS